MSRIGKQPVKIPAGVSVEITDMHVNLKGPKGTLSFNILEGVSVAQE
jgi:large subunit ribosomal protein L6